MQGDMVIVVPNSATEVTQKMYEFNIWIGVKYVKSWRYDVYIVNWVALFIKLTLNLIMY
jgi:hypothetical protein